MGDCTTQTGRLEPAKTADKADCQNGRKRAISAKMAATSKSCAKRPPANIMPNKKYFSTIFSSFFLLTMPIPNV
jgi:hypothetical protein